MTYHIEERTLHFKQPAGTSRGVYTTRKIWLVYLPVTPLNDANVKIVYAPIMPNSWNVSAQISAAGRTRRGTVPRVRSLRSTSGTVPSVSPSALIPRCSSASRQPS